MFFSKKESAQPANYEMQDLTEEQLTQVTGGADVEESAEVSEDATGAVAGLLGGVLGGVSVPLNVATGVQVQAGGTNVALGLNAGTNAQI